MRVKAYIFNVTIDSTLSSNIDSRTFGDLVEIYPDGLKKYREHSEFSVRGLPADDPVVSRVIERIERGGYILSGRPSNKPNHVGYSLVHEYEEEDFEGVSYFELVATDSDVKAGYRDEQKRLRLGISSTRRGMDIGSTGSEYFVPTRMKELIAASGLVGPAFVETVPTKSGGFGGPARWRRPGEEWWELTSSIRMPPVSPRMDAHDDWGNPVNPAEFEGPVQFYGGFRSPVEYRYTAESLRAMPAFDLARIFERRTLSLDGDVTLIASRRFRDFCREHELKVDWVPVRVDKPEE